jgi:hypothetical protein
MSDGEEDLIVLSGSYSPPPGTYSPPIKEELGDDFGPDYNPDARYPGLRSPRLPASPTFSNHDIDPPSDSITIPPPYFPNRTYNEFVTIDGQPYCSCS